MGFSLYWSSVGVINTSMGLWFLMRDVSWGCTRKDFFFLPDERHNTTAPYYFTHIPGLKRLSCQGGGVVY